MKFKLWLEQIETFFGLKDLQEKLNSMLKPVFLKTGADPNIHHIVAKEEDGEKILEIAMFSFSKENFERYNYTKEELNTILRGISYYLDEWGIKHGQPGISPYDSNIIYIKLGNLPTYDQSNFDSIKDENPVIWNRLRNGTAVNVLDIGYEIRPGTYHLNRFIDDMDYVVVDNRNVRFITSIGRNLATGEIHASVGGEFYENPEYETLWLR